MCGRFVAVSSPTLLAERFAVDEVAVADEEPHYNVAPRAVVAVVRERSGEAPRRVLSPLRWGLVPSWAKDLSVGDRQINARAETLATRPAYRRAFERRRCIIPADGFYEWQKIPVPGTTRVRRQPFFVHRRDGEPMAFAGLWEVWRLPDGTGPVDGADADGWLRTCTIVTTRANATLRPLHDRMPVLLPERAWDAWLDRERRDPAGLDRWLVPASDEELEAYPVGPLVSRADNDGPELVRRVELADPGDGGGDAAGDSALTLFS
ncbi:MAG TPA: SOS response-associated peptidase [Acidimicrobiia bacterium]|nr:SOS response-associated peptidase [Acidimicrobiia bacterium]